MAAQSLFWDSCTPILSIPLFSRGLKKIGYVYSELHRRWR
jgi:hypothetical protein